MSHQHETGNQLDCCRSVDQDTQGIGGCPNQGRTCNCACSKLCAKNGTKLDSPPYVSFAQLKFERRAV